MNRLKKQEKPEPAPESAVAARVKLVIHHGLYPAIERAYGKDSLVRARTSAAKMWEVMMRSEGDVFLVFAAYVKCLTAIAWEHGLRSYLTEDTEEGVEKARERLNEAQLKKALQTVLLVYGPETAEKASAVFRDIAGFMANQPPDVIGAATLLLLHGIDVQTAMLSA